MMSVDRRVARTQHALKQAFLEVIVEYGYDNITIQTITDRADVSHSTFYLHYRNRRELLEAIIDDRFNRLLKNMRPQRSQWQVANHNPGMQTFQHFSDHAALYRAILDGQDGTVFVRCVQQALAEVMQSDFRIMHGNRINELRLAIVSQAVAGSLVALVLWWLEADKQQPISTVLETYRDFLFKGLPGVLLPQQDENGPPPPK
jgi:AcrR family transcriptional regulator